MNLLFNLGNQSCSIFWDEFDRYIYILMIVRNKAIF